MNRRDLPSILDCRCRPGSLNMCKACQIRDHEADRRAARIEGNAEWTADGLADPA